MPSNYTNNKSGPKRMIVQDRTYKCVVANQINPVNQIKVDIMLLSICELLKVKNP